jgi:hypothetical protein
MEFYKVLNSRTKVLQYGIHKKGLKIIKLGQGLERSNGLLLPGHRCDKFNQEMG